MFDYLLDARRTGPADTLVEVVPTAIVDRDRTRPPEPHELRAAVAGAQHVLSRPAAAWHVGLPRDEVPGIAVRRVGSAWHYRGRQVPATSDPLADVAAVVAAGHRPGDRYPNPSGPPVSWVRPRRSGAFVVCFGADVLLGAPPLRGAAGVPAAAMLDLLAAFDGGLDVAPPAQLLTAHGTFRLDGDAAWTMSAVGDLPALPLPEPLPHDPRGRAVAATTVLHAPVCRALGVGPQALQSVDTLVDDDGMLRVVLTVRVDVAWDALVPAVVRDGAVQLGVPHGAFPAQPSPAGEVGPARFTLWGRNDAGELLAAAPSGLRVQLRPRRSVF